MFLSHLFISRSKKFAFCVPPKNACTAFKMLLARVENIPFSDVVDLHSRDKLPTAAHISLEEAENILTDPSWTLITVTRNPFTRFVSGFKDKFGADTDDEMRKRWGCKAYYGQDRLTQSLLRKISCPPTVGQLLWLLGKTDPVNWNEHFAPQTLLCRHHEVDYDYVFATETVQDHIAPALAELGIDASLYPSSNAGGHATHASKSACSFWNATGGARGGVIEKFKALYAEDLDGTLGVYEDPRCSSSRR